MRAHARTNHRNRRIVAPTTKNGEYHCEVCGKEIPEDHVVYCDMRGAPLYEECGTTGLCSTCAELWESEIDLEDMEAEEE